MRILRRNVGLLALAGAVCGLRGQGLVPPLKPDVAREARKLLEGFKSNPRGPYVRIRWYCADGTVLPPAGLPCKERGGGFQHGELSPAALKLAGWNLDVGTVLAGLPFEEFLDAKRDHHRLKQLVLEQYLVEVDQGWVYRRARYYRGAKQAEDESKAGRRLLVQLLSDPAWVARHYYLVNQVAAAVPHGAADATVRRIRTLAKSVADVDTRFQPIRIQIHSTPGPSDLGTVEKYLQDKDAQGKARELAAELAELLRRVQTGQSLEAQVGAYRKRLAGTAVAAKLEALAAALGGKDREAAYRAGAAASLEIQKAVAGSADGRRNLDLLDLNGMLQEFGFRVEGQKNGTRRERLARLVDDLRYAVGAGLLSARQFEALRKEAEGLKEEVTAEGYFQAVRYLAKSTEWCRATVGKDFGPVMRLYQDVEPAAGGLVDHLVRGSVALGMSARLDPLVSDANQAVGIRHAVFGQASSRGIVALNPGVASGRLGIVEPGHEEGAIDPNRIYVIPETLADLKPMAGILTLDSGNALSHAQLLAANLGIPNATLPSAMLPVLRQYKDKEIVYAVTPRGTVVLREKSSLSAEELKIWVEQPRARIDLDTSKLKLEERRILSLRDLGVKDSGILVGPKAANLAQLMSYFPDKVAPALALPFGIYYQHIDRVLDGSGVTLRQQIQEALAGAETLRAAGGQVEAVREYIYPRLAKIRKSIETMPLLPACEQELAKRMETLFGPEGSYGVFIRSDTNAEDLPEFTGAGLNLTVPNRVGNRNIFEAVKEVWASPFTERAYDWRARVLRSQERVLPSVIVMRAVPSDKSGVIATMNLETGARGEITVNVSEGVSAVVDGGVAESLLLKPNGEVRLLEQARNPSKRVSLAGGGSESRPTSGSDYVLLEDEIRQLRAMVAEVEARYPKVRTDLGEAMPWDIEFGFEKGQLRLFQIRPLVRSKEGRAGEALGPVAEMARGAMVRLDERI